MRTLMMLFLNHMLTHNVKQFNETGVEKTVTLSPHAYNIMKHIYPFYGLEPEVVHYTEYLDQIWKNDNMKFAKDLDMEDTYHHQSMLGN